MVQDRGRKNRDKRADLVDVIRAVVAILAALVLPTGAVVASRCGDGKGATTTRQLASTTVAAAP